MLQQPTLYGIPTCVDSNCQNLLWTHATCTNILMLALLSFKIAFKLFNTKSNINRAACPHRGISFTEFAGNLCRQRTNGARRSRSIVSIYMRGIIIILSVCLPFIIITPLSASHLFSLPLATFLSVYHHISTRLYFPSLIVSFRTVFGNRPSARIRASSELYSANLPAFRRPRTTDGPRRSREPNHYNACWEWWTSADRTKR